MKRRALISVTDKTGVVEFAQGLQELGFSLLSTGGTFAVLDGAGLEVEQVADYTGFPEMMTGRVKTLHPRVHGGLLGQRDDPEVLAAMREHGIDAIDVLAVNLYRFREAASRPSLSEAEIVENIDIGGPAMIRSAAKNHVDVTVVVDPADYGKVIDTLKENDLAAVKRLRRLLAATAFAHTASYDTAIAEWFATRVDGPEEAPVFGATVNLMGSKVADLRYGENPHQQAAFYSLLGASENGLAQARQLGGKELSYNNIVDLDAALGVVLEFDEPACAIVKHTNPCGAATGADAGAAFGAALASDPVSAFGGIVAFNREIDADVARRIAAGDVFVEAMVAPGFSDEAVQVLQGIRGGKNLRLLALGGLPERSPPWQVRQVCGGLLAQSPDAPDAGALELETATERAPSDDERAVLAFAWRVCKHTKSNAIVLAARVDGALATVGVGAGQMSRVDSVRIAAEKAGDRAKGSVLASDAFFPFADGVETAAAAGVVAVIQPGGSRRDDEVVAAANGAGMAMVFTGRRHFRH